MIGGGLIGLLIAIAIIGVVFYVLSTLPMAEPFPTVLRVVAVLICLVIVLRFLGVWI